MNKWNYIFIIAALFMQTTVPKDTLLQRQYKSFKNDVLLVKKCYLTKSATCSADERAQAPGAALRAIGKGLAIAGALVGGSYIAYKASQWYSPRMPYGGGPRINRVNEEIEKVVHELLAAEGIKKDMVDVHVVGHETILVLKDRGNNISSGKLNTLLPKEFLQNNKIKKVEVYNIHDEKVAEKYTLSRQDEKDREVFTRIPEIKKYIAQQLPELSLIEMDLKIARSASTNKYALFVTKQNVSIPPKDKRKVIINEIHKDYPSIHYLIFGSPDKKGTWQVEKADEKN